MFHLFACVDLSGVGSGCSSLDGVAVLEESVEGASRLSMARCCFVLLIRCLLLLVASHSRRQRWRVTCYSFAVVVRSLVGSFEVIIFLRNHSSLLLVQLARCPLEHSKLATCCTL